MDFIRYNLKDNPFRVGPEIDPNKLIWVGREALKEKIKQRINYGIKTSPSRLVLNWGSYGSGKTHAANFFTRTNYIKENFDAETKNLKINLPRSSKNIVQAFLRALLGQLNFSNIIKDFEDLEESFPNKIEEIIESSTQDSIIADFLKLFVKKGKYFENNKQLFDKEIPYDIIKDMLYGNKIDKPTQNQLQVSIGLDDDEQIVNLLSGIFNCITYNKKIYNCVFLWIDEFEDIDTLPKSTQDRFTTFLRQLFDKTPNHLNIFINFTLKTYTDRENLSFYLGEALTTRTSAYIEFDDLSINNAEKYLLELLNHKNFRTSNDNYNPFTRASVNVVLNNIGKLSIRKINETFSLLIELALIEKDPPNEIDLKFIHEVKSELIHYKG